MPVSERFRELVTRSQSEDTAVSWPAMRLLGLLAERHFQAVVEALEHRDPVCSELRALAEMQAGLEGEPGMVESGTQGEIDG